MEEEIREEGGPAEDGEQTPKAKAPAEVPGPDARPPTAVSSEKLAAKAKLRGLKAQRQEAIENKERDRLAEIRKQMKKIKRKLRGASSSPR